MKKAVESALHHKSTATVAGYSALVSSLIFSACAFVYAMTTFVSGAHQLFAVSMTCSLLWLVCASVVRKWPETLWIRIAIPVIGVIGLGLFSDALPNDRVIALWIVPFSISSSTFFTHREFRFSVLNLVVFFLFGGVVLFGPVGLWMSPERLPELLAKLTPLLALGSSLILATVLHLKSSRLLERLDEETTLLSHQARLANLGEQSAHMAHELRNALTFIDGSLPLLKKYREKSERFDGKLEAIGGAVDRITAILSNVTRFSRRNSESTPTSPVLLSKVIGTVISFVAAKAKAKNVELIFEGAQDILLNCNQIEIEQVIINLVNNAIDAVEALSERWVKLIVQQFDGQVVIRVMDSGRVSPEVAKKIFTPYYTTKVEGMGTGLGLRICSDIVNRHQGSLELNSQFENTCFEIRLPSSVDHRQISSGLEIGSGGAGVRKVS